MIFLILITLMFLLCLTGYLYYQMRITLNLLKEMAKALDEDHKTNSEVYHIIHDYMKDTNDYLMNEHDYVTDLFKELS